MSPERRDSRRAPRERPQEEWLDIPDPLPATSPRGAAFVPPPAIPSPTRARVRTRRALAFAGSLLWTGAMILFWGLRSWTDGGRAVVGQAFALAALIVLILTVALARGRRGLGTAAPFAALLAVFAPLLFIAVTFPSFQPGIGSFDRLLRCFAVGLLTMAPVVALAIGSVRRSFAVGAKGRGAALGAAAGLGAALVLTLHCDIPFAGHVALAHGLPIVLASLLGAFLGQKLARA